MFEPVCGNNLGCRLSIIEAYELLDGPHTLKYIQFERLQWARHVVRMNDTNETSTAREISWRKACERPRLRPEDIRRNSLVQLNGIATVYTIVECLRTDCNILGDKVKKTDDRRREGAGGVPGTCRRTAQGARALS